MALGTNYARGSRKTDLIILIAAARNEIPDAAEIRRLRRMKVDDLYALYRKTVDGLFNDTEARQ